MSGILRGVGNLLAGGLRRNLTIRRWTSADSQRGRASLAANLVKVAFSFLLIIALYGIVGAWGQTRSDGYNMAIGAGFLCESGEPGDCTAVSKSANGDSYELSGAGTFDPQSKSAHAAGTFRHRSTTADILESGVWTASELISFESYGPAPNAVGVNAQRRGPKRLPVQSPMLPIGGLAVFKLRLVAMSGVSKTALLQVNRALGNISREHSFTGIRIKIDGSDSEYVEDGSGRVVLQRFGPEINSRIPKTLAAQP